MNTENLIQKIKIETGLFHWYEFLQYQIQHKKLAYGIENYQLFDIEICQKKHVVPCLLWRFVQGYVTSHVFWATFNTNYGELKLGTNKGFPLSS